MSFVRILVAGCLALTVPGVVPAQTPRLIRPDDRYLTWYARYLPGSTP